MPVNAPDDLSHEQLETITETVYKLYRYDFRQYAKASLKRRLLRIMNRFDMSYLTFLRSLEAKPTFIHQFITELTVNVTEMFRDTFVFRSIREHLIPQLRDMPAISIWHAGCSTGEEVLSMALLLRQEKLLHKTSLLGTDLNPLVLQQAKKGMIHRKSLEEAEARFKEIYPNESIATYFTSQFDYATVASNLCSNLSYQTHNLVSDPSPGKFDLIVCRNVYIYFELGLQEKVLELLYNSLNPKGFLCLGSKETIRFARHAKKFEIIDLEARIFQRID